MSGLFEDRSKDRGPKAPPAASSQVPLTAKIAVSGGMGVGKTTFIGAISEIEPLDTETAITEVSVGVDTLDGVEGKTTTTVAMDFGRISLDASLVLYLFGTPGQDRFSFLWDDLVQGALGTVILVDTRRIEDSFLAVDYFEERAAPFILALNRFDGADPFEPGEVRAALGLGADVPVVHCDARDRSSVRDVLVALMEQVLSRHIAAQQKVAAPAH